MAVIATGFFDGVHKGHRLVIEALLSEARRRGDRAVVITFWPHPRMVLQQDARDFRLLTSMEEKKSILASLGVDETVVVPFTREFASLPAEEYLKLLKRDYGAECIVLGYDTRIGADQTGPSETVEIASRLGLGSVVAAREGNISSTMIRNALVSGDVEAASGMLGYGYALEGVVVSGNRIGTTLGFPTANMQLCDPHKLVPGNGSYLTKVHTLGKDFYGMTNIGVRPTVSDSAIPTIETHIFGFDEMIYGLDIRISFVSRLRPEKKFGSREDLIAQLAADKDKCLSLIQGR